MPTIDDPNEVYAVGVDTGERERLERRPTNWRP